MVDVAHAAGVSHQTVSRVLNGHSGVRPATRARVLQAVEQLGYRPNLAARALASRRSGVIGILAMETTLFGPATTLYAVERAARREGRFVSVASVDAPTPESVHEAVEHLLAQDVEGLLAIAPLEGAVQALDVVPQDVPVVVVEGGDHGRHSAVSVDQVGGAARATEHLLAQGAATVVHVAGPAEWFEARGREQGWRQALAAHGIAAPELLRGDWSAASGYAVGQHLAERADVRAVFFANDQMALGALRAFHEGEVRVPDDVLVAGFDDIPEAAYLTPPLTTVRQDLLAVGRHAVDLLLETIAQGPLSPRSVVVPAELVMRQSTIGSRRPGR